MAGHFAMHESNGLDGAAFQQVVGEIAAIAVVRRCARPPARIEIVDDLVNGRILGLERALRSRLDAIDDIAAYGRLQSNKEPFLTKRSLRAQSRRRRQAHT
jgi:hypothetical protein